jgi:signal transduction histidine kinase
MDGTQRELEREYLVETGEKTVQTGRLYSALAIALLAYFMYQDVVLVGRGDLWPWRLIALVPALAFLLGSLTFLHQRPHLAPELHALSLLGLMTSMAGVVWTYFRAPSPIQSGAAGMIGGLAVVTFIMFVMAAGARRYLVYIVPLPLALLFGLLALDSRLEPDEWLLFANPMTGAVAVLAAAWLQERMSRREFLARKQAEHAKAEVEAGMNVLEVMNRRLEEEVEERKEVEGRLKKSNEELQQFAYAVSHDLKEPLRAVASFLGLVDRRLASRGGADQDVHEFIGYAVDGAKRMDRLIDDLLEYSRVHTRGRAFQAVDLNDVLDQACGNLALAIEESGARLHVSRLPTVTADPHQMVQLFQNLLGNAIKYHKPDVPPEVGVAAHEQEGVVQVEVRDNGIGVAPENFERIFVLFQRLHTTEEYEGTGIGLAVCKRIVERHGGSIGVESTPGQGCTFRVSLPR